VGHIHFHHLVTGYYLHEESMKKTFILTHPKIKRPRLIEAIKHEVKKYVKRERGKTLPPGVDFWDFDCKFGPTAEEAIKIHLAEINKHIDKIDQQQLDSFYLEVLVKTGHRRKKEAPGE
jgi:hypothetical protein